MKIIKIILKYLILFVIFGVVYIGIEYLFRSKSHISMMLLGGLCGCIVGGINEFFSWKTPFLLQCIIGGITITILELITGYIVNIKLGWNVWDYSNLSCSFFDGQINLFFSLAWVLLSGVAIVLDDWLRYWLFKEEKPHYKFL